MSQPAAALTRTLALRSPRRVAGAARSLHSSISYTTASRRISISTAARLSSPPLPGHRSYHNDGQVSPTSSAGQSSSSSSSPSSSSSSSSSSGPPPPSDKNLRNIVAALIAGIVIARVASFGWRWRYFSSLSAAADADADTGAKSNALNSISTTASPPGIPLFDEALAALKSHFSSPESMSTDPEDLHSKGYSSWCHHDASLPSVIVYPTCTDDVVAIVNIAREHRVALVPFAGGTSLEAHWYAPRDPKTGETLPCICICFERMDALVELDDQSGFCRVQPGLGWQDLNEELKSRGSNLFWPVDPGPGAAFGGMLATGGSGTGAVRYGTMKGDLVLNVTVVLPSGEVIKTRSDARKSAAGPDLTKLFLGSEGTLGVITEATLRLVPRLPESVVTVAFASVDDACRAVRDILNRGVGVASIELLDDDMIRAINYASRPDPPHKEAPSLFIKFAGTPTHTAEDQRIAQAICAQHGADVDSVRLSRDAAHVEALWESRKVALWSAMQYRDRDAPVHVNGGGDADAGDKSGPHATATPHAPVRCWTTDVCVPIGRLPELVRRVQADLAAQRLDGPIVGHVGDGNFHSLIVFREGDADEFRRAQGVVHRMVHLAQDLGGTATGEHGVGIGKKAYLERELGSGTVDLLRSVKRLLDPTGFMNPGKLVDV